MNVTARAPMEYAVISVVHWRSSLSGLLRSLRRILRFVKKATTSRIRYATTSGAPPSIAHAFHCTSTNSQSFSGGTERIAQVRVNHSPSSQAGTEEIREGEICQIFDFHAAIFVVHLRRIIGRECLESTPNLFRSERDAQGEAAQHNRSEGNGQTRARSETPLVLQEKEQDQQGDDDLHEDHAVLAQVDGCHCGQHPCDVDRDAQCPRLSRHQQTRSEHDRVEPASGGPAWNVGQSHRAIELLEPVEEMIFKFSPPCSCARIAANTFGSMKPGASDLQDAGDSARDTEAPDEEHRTPERDDVHAKSRNPE